MQVVESRTQDFNLTSQRVTVPGSTNGQTANRVVLISRTVPNGSRILLRLFSAKVIDLANSDQVYFSIERNGTPVMSGLERVPGEQFDFQSQITIDLELPPGIIELVAYNISGAGQEPNAVSVATDVRCQAWCQARLLSAKYVERN